jgi:CPA2 family monovalent cation:H+ antiporter-2
MHLAPLIRDLAVILGVAAIVTFVFRRIRQPVVLGYIMAGVIVGPYAPAFLSITDLPNVQVWADLGVIFLMLSLGLEFSFKKLARLGLTSGLTALVEVSLMVFLGFHAGRMLGWTDTDSVFLGCMIAISSTTIIVKTLDELGLKSRQFAETVFGILVVEDLVAILILVVLSSFAIGSSFGGVELVLATIKLAFVVGIWVLVGLFVVPRLVRWVGKFGNDEMLTVMALGLCLSLVAVSAALNYSVALGSFIMGSILAESTESHRIERLVKPLKDTFAAVFFVSVGMLIDPAAILANIGTIVVVTLLLLVGKVVSISVGALVSGHTLTTALQSGFSMAQIGEFSFIIATLGQTAGVISPSLYPVIVAVSLATTGATPYMIRASQRLAAGIDRRLPRPVRQALAAYRGWVQRRQAGVTPGQGLRATLARWGASALVVVAVFTMVDNLLLPWIAARVSEAYFAALAGWGVSVTLTSPFVWSMLIAFRDFVPPARVELEAGRAPSAWTGLPRLSGLFLSRLATIMVVGILSMKFFVSWQALALTVFLATMLSLLFSRQLGGFYDWFETQFKANVKSLAGEIAEIGDDVPHRLAPWNARLVRVEVHPNSPVCGKSLIELAVRDQHGVNVVAIQRGVKTLVAPPGGERLFPGDELLVLGSDEQIDAWRGRLEAPLPPTTRDDFQRLSAYELRQVVIAAGSPLCGCTIKDSRIREDFANLVVGVERGSERLLNPRSDFVLGSGDRVWLVGTDESVTALASVAAAVA